MRKTLRYLILLLVVIMTTSCVKGDGGEVQTKEWTDGDVILMQESWCEYNEGRDFAKEQCEEFWSD